MYIYFHAIQNLYLPIDDLFIVKSVVVALLFSIVPVKPPALVFLVLFLVANGAIILFLFLDEPLVSLLVPCPLLPLN